MHTGRSRVVPASSAACSASLPSARASLAKLSTRMLLAVATPMVMIAPINAGTLKVVCVKKSNHTMPAKAPGRAMMMMKGSDQD